MDQRESTTYIIHAKVLKVEQIKRILRTRKDGTSETSDAGWFVQFEGSWEALSLGFEKPDLAPGDNVKITFQKESNA